MTATIDWIIRKARQSDIEVIADKIKEILEFSTIFDSRYSLTSNWRESTIEFVGQQHTDETYHLMLAEHNDCIVGYCAVCLMYRPPIFKDIKYRFIETLFVNKEF